MPGADYDWISFKDLHRSISNPNVAPRFSLSEFGLNMGLKSSEENAEVFDKVMPAWASDKSEVFLGHNHLTHQLSVEKPLRRF
jgi:hypothetical protein